MRSRLDRFRALQAAMDALRKIVERDLGQAMGERAGLVRQRVAIETALQNQHVLGDLILTTSQRRMGMLAGKIAELDRGIAKHRKRAADCFLKSKRVAAEAERLGREVASQMARLDLAELTDQAAGRGLASLPQAKRS
jgi:hypothetical protein